MRDAVSYMNPSVVDVPKSGIRKFFDVAATIPGAISLGVGEPDFITPYHIRDAAINSLLDGETQYTSNWGLLSLRSEIARYLEERFGLCYDPAKEILVTVGASEGIDLALRILCAPGDEVLIPEPSYVSYAPGVIFAGGTPVPIPTYEENGFALTADAVEQHITPRTKGIILPYPNNPTGAILEAGDLRAIAEVIVKHDLICVSDEIYAELTYTPAGHVSVCGMPGMRERTILINGFSKAFAMTGWRMGYVCAPHDFCDMMCKIHQYSIMCAPRQGQVAAEEALRCGRENGWQDVIQMRESYNQRRRLMLDSFRNLGLSCFEPRGAFYVFPCIKRTGLSSDVFCERLLREQKVVTVPGTAFGASGEGYIRCSYATGIDKLSEALRRIGLFLDSL